MTGISDIVKQMKAFDGFKDYMGEQIERIAVATERIADATERLVELEEAKGEGISE